MAIAEESSGSQTATIGTTHTLASPTTNKTRVLVVDVANMAAGDIVEFTVEQKVRTGDTVRVHQTVTYSGAQGEPVIESIPFAMLYGGNFKLKQTAGTGRAFPWAVRTLD